MKTMSRRTFMKTMAASGAVLGLGNLAACKAMQHTGTLPPSGPPPVVSVVKIRKGKVDDAVREAIDLIGGLETVAKDKERIMLKPNLVGPDIRNVTKPEVTKALARLMRSAGKEVLIGEGSAAAAPNFRPEVFGSVCSTTDTLMLDEIQRAVFEKVGYTDLSESLNIPLINLHTGEMAATPLPDGFVYKEIRLHRSLTEIDMLCSVPMMKTHSLAAVTLAMKNLIGLYPGQVYGTVRSSVHHTASKVEASGTASAIVDMVRANKLGLVVIDASMAMQAQGPTVQGGGKLVAMDLIIAGTNPLATDMVAAHLMGFQPEEVSTFVWAWKAGLGPGRLEEIETRGVDLAAVKQRFQRPTIYPWQSISQWGPPC
jgi:uncharacterized protein (DUF362 family)